ncbi:MAG: hypothetical protein KIS96_11595 [Bauldia sp.]|nr:hypothetical protein [Bauldia sp.]
MRHSRSDEQKRQRNGGRIDGRFTEEARAMREVDKVVAFPKLREVPEPTVPLGTNGRKTFDFWTRRLLEVGLLTAVSIGYVENLALADDKIHERRAAGKEVPDKTLELRRSMLLKLEALNVDQNLVPNPEKTNKFARNGFPGRSVVSAGG